MNSQLEERKTLFKKTLDAFKDVTYGIGADTDPVGIETEIGYDWEPFGEIPGDQIKKVNTGYKNTSTFLYKSPVGKFRKHRHRVAETCAMIYGRAIFHTSKTSLELGPGDCIKFNKMELHHVDVLEPFMILINYYPPFGGDKWQAEL